MTNLNAYRPVELVKVVKSGTCFPAPFLTASFFLALYVFSLSPNLGAAHDSVYYLRSIETGVALMHPHHLIYNAVGRGWMLLTGLAAPLSVPLLNALFGAITILLLHRFLIELVGQATALFWTLLYGASFGPWFYAATIEVYLLPLPFLLVAFRLAHRPTPTFTSSAACGALLGIAILGHQTNVLILPALLLNEKWKMNFLHALTLMATTAVTAGLPYILAARHAGESLAVWSTFYLRELDLGYISIMTLPKALVGFGRFFIGGHFLFAFERLPWLEETRLESLLSGHHLADERFLVRNMPLALGGMLALLTAAWFGGLGLLLVRARRRAVATVTDRNVTISLVAWFLAYALFFTWWEPANVEFWIATMIPAVLLAARLTAPLLGQPGERPWFVLPITLFLINALGSIEPLSNAENDYYRQKALEIIATHDETVSKDEWIIGPYVERLRE